MDEKVLTGFMSPLEVANRIQRSPQQVIDYLKRGRLKCFRIGKQKIHYFLREDVEKLAKELGV